MKKIPILAIVISFLSAPFSPLIMAVEYQPVSSVNGVEQRGVRDTETGINTEGGDNLSAEPELRNLKFFDGTRRSIILMGAFAASVSEETKFSQEKEIGTDCLTNDFIKLRYKFDREEPFFIGVAIKNKNESSRELKVEYDIFGPGETRFNKSFDVKISEKNVCLVFAPVSFFASGTYKLRWSAPSKGVAEMFFEISEKLFTTPTPPTPTPTPTPAPTPTPTLTVSPTATP